MTFYIYENWQAGPHKAIIHKGSCGFCNNGKGMAGGYDPNHAEWHGPFRNLEEAKDFSKNLEDIKYRKECMRCMKRYN